MTLTLEEAIEYFKFQRKIFCEEHLKICPKDSIAYQATLKEKEFYNMAIKALEQKSRWIPVSKRLPEKYVEVLATTKLDGITIGEMFSDNDWFIHEGATNANLDDIKAWMPLPTPFKL